MYKAVFIDIDGTLIRTDHTLSQTTIDTIARAKAKGVHVTLVSARPLHGILPISNRLGVVNTAIASLNGSYIAENDRVVFSSTIDADLVEQVHAETARFAVTPIYYRGLEWFAETENQYTEKERRITDVPLTVQPFEQTLARWQAEKTGPNKIMIVGDAEVIAETEAHLKTLYGPLLNIYTSKPVYLEVMNRNASKANAVKVLSEALHIPREETIAIGDNFNDQHMIEYAGLGIAMGNAPDAVKQSADYVTDTNNNDGVAKALTHFLEL
jgi:Cof subfamily protein (haloacid dehalogenase superfamily)